MTSSRLGDGFVFDVFGCWSDRCEALADCRRGYHCLLAPLARPRFLPPPKKKPQAPKASLTRCRCQSRTSPSAPFASQAAASRPLSTAWREGVFCVGRGRGGQDVFKLYLHRPSSAAHAARGACAAANQAHSAPAPPRASYAPCNELDQLRALLITPHKNIYTAFEE
jgi:hypothetical protein